MVEVDVKIDWGSQDVVAEAQGIGMFVSTRKLWRPVMHVCSSNILGRGGEGGGRGGGVRDSWSWWGLWIEIHLQEQHLGEGGGVVETLPSPGRCVSAPESPPPSSHEESLHAPPPLDHEESFHDPPSRNHCWFLLSTLSGENFLEVKGILSVNQTELQPQIFSSI